MNLSNCVLAQRTHHSFADHGATDQIPSMNEAIVNEQYPMDCVVDIDEMNMYSENVWIKKFNGNSLHGFILV